VVELVEMDCAYKDDIFAQAIADRFLEMLEPGSNKGEDQEPFKATQERAG
jgi:hypothetical protein